MFNPATELSENVRSKFFIGGQWLSPQSGKTVSLVAPATEEPFLTVPQASIMDVDAAVNAARRAFDGGQWPHTTPGERSVILRRMGGLVAQRLPLLSRLWTAQVGAPTWFADMFTPTAVAMLEYYSELAQTFAFEEQRPTRGGHARVIRQPVGVAALIAPWNAQLPILSYKVGAALAAGCCVVVKSPLETPLDALVLAECAEQAGLPAGVLNVITGDADAGAHLVGNPGIDKVSFTGSTATGKIIAGSCIERLARFTLELGGKSAAIVLEDAPLETALQALVPFTMPFSGQICFSQTRILVPRKQEAAFLEAYGAAIRSLKVGDPWDPTTQIGPLASKRQFERVLGYIESGRREGAQVVAGGGQRPVSGKGYFVEPTVFSGVSPEMTIAREEIFGPVVVVMPYDDVDEAVALANNSDFGLSGTVFSGDIERAASIARRIKTGHVCVNGLEMAPNVPFGGFKQSGMGREGGPEGLMAFLEDQAIYLPVGLQATGQG
ncbi:MAG: aldehyde dehydrogenase [Elusimicrobiota bacterium]|jgi:acyl-CoA reductase-like NAD-dependent aldehyde dehydrogenase